MADGQIKYQIMEVALINPVGNLPQSYGKKIPIEVEIGADCFTIKPQYPDTQMRSIWPVIPEGEPIFLNNWTAGPRIGQRVQPTDTVSDLLLESNKTVPKLRVYWENCPTFKVRVDLHDILILHYDELNIFHYMADLFDSIANDIKKKFKLKKNTVLKLRVEEGQPKYRRLVFVGKYFDLDKVNKIKVMINFEESLPIQFVKCRNNRKYQHLICPISQLIMQQPVVTTCKHKFDKLCLALAIEKNGKCPVCRRCLGAGDFKSARELSRQINKLKQLEVQSKIAESQKNFKQPESN